MSGRIARRKIAVARRRVATVNPFLNTPPTELRRDLETEKDSEKRRLMTEALNAWRVTVPGPFRQTAQGRQEILSALMTARTELQVMGMREQANEIAGVAEQVRIPREERLARRVTAIVIALR